MSNQPLVFDDRADAGKQLADALPQLDPAQTVIIALPRGGVPVAAEICAMHGAPLDLVLVRKIGAPGQPELAVGAITDGDTPQVTVNDSVARYFGLSQQDVEKMGQALLPEMEQRRQSYLVGRAPLPLRGKTVVVVDDGVATGATLRASLSALASAKPKRIIVALPVGPKDLAEQLQGVADEIICLSDLRYFGAVGGAYRSFPQTSDEAVRTVIKRYAPA